MKNEMSIVSSRWNINFWWSMDFHYQENTGSRGWKRTSE